MCDKKREPTLRDFHKWNGRQIGNAKSHGSYQVMVKFFADFDNPKPDIEKPKAFEADTLYQGPSGSKYVCAIIGRDKYLIAISPKSRVGHAITVESSNANAQLFEKLEG